MATDRIDLHAHLIPPEYVAELERRSLLPFPLPPWSLDLTYETMARYEIDAAALSLSPPGVFFGDGGLARDLARMVNEQAAQLVGSDPRRFAALASLPLPDVDAALSELAYALDVLGLDGVALLSNVAGVYLGDPAWDPLFDELDRRGAYVFVHPNSPPYAPPLGGYPVWLHEFPFDTTRAVVNLLYSGTLARCPNLRLQLSHLGGTVPFLTHRIASLVARNPEFAEHTPEGPQEYLGRLYYDTGLSNNDAALAATLRVTGLDHVVFGTDWPYADLPRTGADPAPGLADLAPEDRSRIEAANATALLPRMATRVGP